MTIDHEQRKHSIGASEVAGILNISPFTTDHSIWLEKQGLVQPWGGNQSTKIGKKLETVLLDEAEEKYGTLVRNVRVPSPNGAPLTATLDGLVVDAHHPVECKTSGMTGGRVMGDWGEELTDAIPDYYLVQVQAQLYCSGAELAHVFAWLGARGIVEYTVPRDDSLIKIIVSRCSQWWETHMVDGLEPMIKIPPPLELMKRLYRTPNKVVRLNGDACELLDLYEKAKEEHKRAKEILDMSKASVIAMLEDAEEALLPDGRRITYYEQHTKAHMTKESTARHLRVKE